MTMLGIIQHWFDAYAAKWLRFRMLALLLPIIAVALAPGSAISQGSERFHTTIANILTDPTVFELTPTMLAKRLESFGKLVPVENQPDAFQIPMPYGTRAMVQYTSQAGDRTPRLQSLMLLFDPHDNLLGAPLSALVKAKLGTPKTASEPGSNRVIWWELPGGRVASLTLDTPGTEPAQVFIVGLSQR